ncbi:MAG TPA: NAD(P)/FAD-dependent oxidoreductase [Leptolyngbyaceae cyanobacterium M65_K2018_010]|nr:NAD(P)/FAD-dependent oxidoreductase [Leptolyngbyaceae cyanobacterium M65_K2018_010]
MAATADIIIIGAGISGLAAGCYAQMNGYRSQIFELHNLPGGLCTAWYRQGYVFDGCIHYIFGSGPGQPFYSLWEELGAVQTLEFVNHREFMQIRGPSGETLQVHCNPDQLAQHLKDISPPDARLIEAFCQGVRTFKGFDLSLLQQKPKALMTLGDWARVGRQMLPFVRSLGQWGPVSLREWAAQFQHPFLRAAIPHLFAWPDVPVMVGMSLLAYLDNQNAGFPLGASLKFAQAIEQRYLDLGGEIYYSAQVERVLVEGDRAVGVRLYNNQEYRARRVISACDGRRTIFDLLRGQYVNPRIHRLYDGHLPMHSQLQISLGVNRDFAAEPHWVTHLLDRPVLIAGEDRYEIGVKHYCFDPSLAPPGKSVVIVMLTTTYSYWQQIYGRREYHAEEIQEADILIDRLEQFYPGLKADIEYRDVATPLSYERYTGNWQGASCGWLLTKDTLPLMIQGIPKRLPGLGNFYMVGQWTEPGGSVPIVAMSGRNMIQEICHEDHKKFVAITG